MSARRGRDPVLFRHKRVDLFRDRNRRARHCEITDHNHPRPGKRFRSAITLNDVYLGFTSDNVSDVILRNHKLAANALNRSSALIFRSILDTQEEISQRRPVTRGQRVDWILLHRWEVERRPIHRLET